MAAEADDLQVFWGEMSPCEHFVQIYQDDAVLMDALDGFIGGALRNRETAIVIATPPHLAALDRRLRMHGIDVDAAMGDDHYIALDAEHTLSLFMRNGWPEEELFVPVIQRLIERTRGRRTRVRAFGEMVALLWAQGHSGATVRLEHLWNGLCRQESFALFCAYPKTGFTQDAAISVQEICAAHSHVLSRSPETWARYL